MKKPRSADRLGLALVEALFPGGRVVTGADEHTLTRLLTMVEAQGGLVAVAALRAALGTLDLSARCRHGRGFADLDASAQQALVRAWSVEGYGVGPVARSLAVLVGLVHLERRRTELAPARTDRPQRLERPHAGVIEASAWRDGRSLECDVVVIGTGAGGAVVGAELAMQGHGVVFVEAGAFRSRAELGGNPLDAHRRLYAPTAFALGETTIPVFSGSLVGGSTAINTGSCFRAPKAAHERWAELAGDPAFERDGFDPLYTVVENRLGVTSCSTTLAGPIADVIARGCDALGLAHGPVMRNAPDCAAGGFCDFGCVRGARRSTEVSYLPSALARGAVVLTRARMEEVWLEGGRAVGVRVRDADGRTLSVRAGAVVLAAGALRTPGLLRRVPRASQLPALGRHLRLHPSIGIAGVVDERVDGFTHVPQGWASEALLDDGILINAAQHDPGLAASVLGLSGRDLASALDVSARTATLGVLVADLESEGTLVGAVRGHPIARYRLAKSDAARLARGLHRAGDILQAAGATQIMPLLRRPTKVEGWSAWRRWKSEPIRASDLRLVSFHPMGTCRMANDPVRGVVDTHHEVWGVEGLFVVDASVVPGPLGVNPQVAIMAMATRAARSIGAALAS